MFCFVIVLSVLFAWFAFWSLAVDVDRIIREAHGGK